MLSNHPNVLGGNSGGGGGGGTGDVVGPASSTDNAIARFDGTTGKLLQNSSVTVSDTGAITVASIGSTTPSILCSGMATTGFASNGANGIWAIASGAEVFVFGPSAGAALRMYQPVVSNADLGVALGEVGGRFTQLYLGKTVTPSGTTGAQTINRATGSVNFAAAATSLVVTNSLCATTSIITATIATNDTTAANVKVVAGSGSFTIYLGTSPTAETRVDFRLSN